jgi:hypothetical protein
MFITEYLVVFSKLQVLKQIDAKTVCDKLLLFIPEALYCSYLNSDGLRIGEATRVSIASHEKLTIMVLPFEIEDESLVLAIKNNCNLKEIVTTVKHCFSSFR